MDEQTVPRHLTHLARTTGLGELRTAVPSHAKAILGRIGVILALVGAGCAGFGWWLLSPGEPWYDGIVFYVVGLIPFGFGVTMFVLRRRVRPEWLCIHDGGLVHQPAGCVGRRRNRITRGIQGVVRRIQPVAYQVNDRPQRRHQVHFHLIQMRMD